MAVSSLKICWSKLSARIRDYIENVDAYYRPSDEESNAMAVQQVLAELPFARAPPRTSRRHWSPFLAGSGAGGASHATSTTTTKRDSNYHKNQTHHHHHHHHHHCEHNISPSSQGHHTNHSKDRRTSNSNHHHHNHTRPSQNKQHQISNHHHHPQYQYFNPTIDQATLDRFADHQQNVSGSLAPSLSGFVKRKTPQGQVYFLDMNGQKYWHDPSVPKQLLNSNLNLDALVGKLSSNWDVNQTASGKTYYINHAKKTTQFTDPRLIAHKHKLMLYLRQNAGTTYNDTAASPSYETIDEPPPSSFNHVSASSTQVPASAERPNGCTSTSTNTANINITVRLPNTTTREYSLSRHPSHNTNNHACNNQQQHSIHRKLPVKPQPLFMAASMQQQQWDMNSRELFDKISILRQELLKQQVLSHPCRIDINRKRIFEESFRAISQMQPRDLKRRLLVKFRGEEGLDYGGVAREWFYLLSREILNPVHGLFQYTSDDIYNLQINPDSGIVYREHLSYMNFCGRIIGMAVFHGHFIEGHFTIPFYKMLLRKPITLSDIEFVDPDLHRSLCWILSNDITGVIETSFHVEHNAFGQLQEHELKENGKNLTVTEENKHEYVSLYVNYRCRRGIEEQFGALQRGFYELISPSLVENFEEHELELLIGGLSKINIEDWRLHTKLKNCTVDTPLVIWFWDIVKSYDEDTRARLLQFVTGSPRVPIQGFKALQGVNSELRLFTIHMIKNSNTDSLPKSHTCFNRIDLPPYETYDKLRDKLTQAIEETMGFAMQ